ncbi:hypothetical protein AX15_003013 [Amanita polypyramis BW_CC]|nr:hypothetical protein AX15_003013 [Amanita polypyramis BW_CC]
MNLTSTLRKGLLNLPGTTHASKSLVESLLAKDTHEHHCYFRPSIGLHNHLNHHLLAAYDLGASTSLLQKIYDTEAKAQRPIFTEEKDEAITITKENWTKYLGDYHAYGGYFKFFSSNIQEVGVLKTIEQYIFSVNANDGGANMLIRLMSGIAHPFINVGYGLEFGSDTVVAASLAQAAVHAPLPTTMYDFSEATSTKNNPVGGTRQPSRGPSILEIIRQVYDSDILKPVMPYDPDALLSGRIRGAVSEGRAEAIKQICSQLDVDASSGDEEFNAKVEEIIWTTTLLLCATGRPGRKPRLDFFLMHFVTSSLFLPSYFRLLQDPTHKANLLRAYLPGMILLILTRGRPRINPELLMSHTATPRPPVLSSLSPGKDVVGDPREDEDYNPWPAMLESVIYFPDSHVLKTMRTLFYAAQKYGDAPPGSVIGAFSTKDGKETHTGMSKVDGTIFVRSAGMLMDFMGWTGHGQVARDDWDRSALGWDDAWKNGE